MEQEERRLQALYELDLLDGPGESDYDEIVELASAICGTPISLISLVDRDRQWFKSAVGMSERETPRNISFCSYAIETVDLFVVEDATLDPRFMGSTMVTGEHAIRFYAGFPLIAGDGNALGTLCVMDRKPRVLSADQRKALEVLAKQVLARVELRAKHLALERALNEQKALAVSLQASESLFRTFMNNSPFVSFIKDSDGRMLFYNREFAEVFGITTGEWLGKFDQDVFPLDTANTYRKHDHEVLASGVRAEYLEEARRPDGQLVHYRSSKFPYDDGNGNTFLAGVSLDVTEELARKAQVAQYQQDLEEANRHLLKLAVTDGLTGLANRRAFDERFLMEFSTARRKQRQLSIVLLDIDDFKRINDRDGHVAGDQILRDVADVLRETVRISDLAARYGGEEFVILLPESNVKAAALWAERLRNALRERGLDQGRLTLSMGAAELGDAHSAEELVCRADCALYAAKAAGKNAVVAFEASIHNDVLRMASRYARVRELPRM